MKITGYIHSIYKVVQDTWLDREWKGNGT